VTIWRHAEESGCCFKQRKIGKSRSYLLTVRGSRGDGSVKNRTTYTTIFANTRTKAKVAFFPSSSLSPLAFSLVERLLDVSVVRPREGGKNEGSQREEIGTTDIDDDLGDESARILSVSSSARCERARQTDRPSDQVGSRQRGRLRRRKKKRKNREREKGRETSNTAIDRCRYRSAEHTDVVPTRGLANVTPVHCF